MSFRNAKYRDITALCGGIEKAFVPLLKELYPNGYYAYFTGPQWIKDKIDNEFVYVYELEGKIVGAMIIIKAPDEKNLKLHTIYTDEAHRRGGLATIMIKKAEELHGKGVSWKLETLRSLQGNTALYEKMGYEMHGEPKVKENGVTIVYYRKFT